MRRLLPALCLLALCAALSACGQSRTTDYYLLDAGEPALATGLLPGTVLSVDPPALPGYLDRTGIVVRRANGPGVDVAAFNVWAEPLQQSVQRVVVAALAPALVDRGVTALPASVGASGSRYVLSLEILRLDCDTDGRVVLESRWTLEDRAGDGVERGAFSAEERLDLPAFGSKEMFDAVVASESRLIRQFGEDLARRVAPKVGAAR